MVMQRVAPELEQVSAVLAQLRLGDEPVTFYDALVLVRQARRIDELPDELIQHLVALHDAGHTTDGARDILAEFLRGYGQRRAGERRLAERPIALKDSGKTARARVGASLLISLDERRASGYRWVVQRLQGPAQCRRRVDRADGPVRAELDVKLSGCGRVHLTMEETAPAAGRQARCGGARQGRARRFELTVVVESRRG